MLGWVIATKLIRDVTLLPFMASATDTYRLDSFRKDAAAYMVAHQSNLKTYDELTKGHLTTVLKEEEEKEKEKGEKKKTRSNKRLRTDKEETTINSSTATVTTSLAELQLQ